MRADRPARPLHDIPSALVAFDQVVGTFGGRPPMLFLDFDGTLAPIVSDPAGATMPASTRDLVAELTALTSVTVISGRGLEDLRGRVGVGEVDLAGSHGLEIEGPGFGHRVGAEYAPALEHAEGRFRAFAESRPGVEVETKSLGVALHYRNVDEAGLEMLEREISGLVRQLLHDERGLRIIRGKKVVDLRPDLPWDKGTAVRWLMERRSGDSALGVPLYLGDDLTDEHAFEALPPEGCAVVVRGEDDDRTSVASWSLGGTDEVVTFLERLLRWIRNA